MAKQIRVNSMAEAQQYLQLTIEGQAEPAGTQEKEKRDNPEQRVQIAVFAKRRVLLPRYPQLRYLYATLNGIYIPPALLQQIAEAGLVKGVLDLRMDAEHVEEGGRHWAGLCIDVKAEEGRPTPEQLDWAAQLWKIGIRAYFCGGEKRFGLTPLQDVMYTIFAYAGIAGEPAELTPGEEYELAKIVAEANLSKKQARAERDARRLERALKATQKPAPAPRKAAKGA